MSRSDANLRCQAGSRPRQRQRHFRALLSIRLLICAAGLAHAAPEAREGQAVHFTTERAREYVARAREHWQRGRVYAAVEDYTRALQMDRSYAAAYLELGRLRENLGDWREAEKLYGLAIGYRQTQARALFQRSLLQKRLGRKSRAMADLKLAAELDPHQLAWQKTLATWYVEVRAWPAALVIWRRLLAYHEQHESASKPGESSSERTEASLQVRALKVLAAEADPVQQGPDADWIRRALEQIEVSRLR